MIKQVLLVAALCVSFSTAAFAGPSTGYDSSEFVEDSFEAAINSAEVVFPYQENKIYKIYAQKGYITDIKMQLGESIISVTAGDTTRWIIDKAKVGKGRSVIEHLYIKPQYTGIMTNMFINTNQRSYQLLVVAGNYYNPIVSWNIEKTTKSQFSGEMVQNYLAINPQKLNFGYKFNKEELPWAPAKVFDDGRKTYIKMKPEVFSSTMPAFFIIEDDKIVLTNYRIIKGTYIIDRIFNEAQMVVGKEKIRLKRK